MYYARSADGARSFDAAVPLGVADFSKPAHVQLALDGTETVVAAWDDGRERLPRVMMRVSRDGGASFGPEVIASAGDAAATFPVIAVSRDTVTVGWAERARADHEQSERGMGDMKDPKMQMPLISVGAQQIIVRRGLLIS